MDNERDFQLADSFCPQLEEGTYTIHGAQTVTQPQRDDFTVTKEFYIAANLQTVAQEDVFQVYPAPRQQGDFSGTLPFIVLNNEVYPWIRHWTADVDGLRIPWLALILVSEKEGPVETDVTYAELAGLQESGVFFPYDGKAVTTCGKDDMLHILTVPLETYQAVMPAVEDLPWLTHAKFVNLSATEDAVSQQDGWFSTIVANRFVPSDGDTPLKTTAHLICVDGYLNGSIPRDCQRVRFLSLYHWDMYSEKTEDRSFVSLVNGLGQNVGQVSESSLKPHYLRTGEKTYSVYHSPLQPFSSCRNDSINGEETYTADGRLIYDPQTGILDVSYAAAFNLGRLITLSRPGEAEKIAAWRKESAVKRHLKALSASLYFSQFDIQALCGRIKEDLSE